jgi:hypothetical protein
VAWQLSWLPIDAQETAEIRAASAAYRKQELVIRQLGEELRRHPEYEEFRHAQTRLWKTPEYRTLHRRYCGRMQELQNTYGEIGSDGS